MDRDQPRNGGNGHSLVCLSSEQHRAFKSMILLSKHARREILDMIIMYELMEDQPEGKAIRARLQEVRL